MNGVCCRRLLDSVEIIFEEVNKLVKIKLESQGKQENDVMKLTAVVSIFKSLFEWMDMVFSKLRILDPTENEIEEMKRSISALEKLWMQLDLSITPKFHILTTHIIEQIIRFGGIADKVEDFIEKSHQIGKKLDKLVARIKSQCFCKQDLVKIRRQWLQTDPSVASQMISVNDSRKRKFRNIPITTTTKQHKAKVKAERRKRTMSSFDALLDE